MLPFAGKRDILREPDPRPQQLYSAGLEGFLGSPREKPCLGKNVNVVVVLGPEGSHGSPRRTPCQVFSIGRLHEPHAVRQP